MLIRLGGAIAGATVVALLVVGRLPAWNAATPDRLGEQATGAVGETALEQVAGEAPAPSARTTPQLLVGPAAPGVVGDAIPLAISLVNADNTDIVVLNGLPAGSNMTSGRPMGISAWRLFAFELGNAAIRPAQGFLGGADLTVELRRGNRTVDHRTLHLEWTRSPRAATTAALVPAIIAASTRRLAPEEVSLLVRRGEDLVANGDIAAARLLLQRAAEAEPGARSVLEALARAQFDTRRYAAAARTFRQIVEASPSDDYAQFGLGLALARDGNPSAAAEHLALAAAMRPELQHYTDALRGVRATLKARSEAAGGRPAGGDDGMSRR